MVHNPNPPQLQIKPATRLTCFFEAHLEALRLKQYSAYTIKNRRAHIGAFLDWCMAMGLNEPREISPLVLKSYQKYLLDYRKPNGEPLACASQHDRMVPLRVWFRWMTRNDYIPRNPAADIELPRMPRQLPRAVLTATEAERVLRIPNVGSVLGLRNRAIMETFYSTGIRRLELVHLKLEDLDLERATVLIRFGKGNRDRFIPLGDRAAVWVSRYIAESRPQLLGTQDERTVFLSSGGRPLSLDHLTILVGRIVDSAKVGKHGSCHLFRHTMATLMLEGGADIRFIQAMLGHADLRSTQIYTHVAIGQLQAVHRAAHPAKLPRELGPERAVVMQGSAR